jgi:hypothetical protein
MKSEWLSQENNVFALVSYRSYFMLKASTITVPISSSAVCAVLCRPK